MSWLYSINHPTHRNRAACTTQCSTPSVIPVRYPSLPKEFTSLLWAQISAEKNFIYWKFLREKKSKSHQKLFSNLVTRIRVWARIELFSANTNHSQYHSRSRSYAPIQCSTTHHAPKQCKHAKIPAFLYCSTWNTAPKQCRTVQHKLYTHQNSAEHCSTWNNTTCNTWHDSCTERFCAIYSAIQCNTVPYSAIQCHTVIYSAIQCKNARGDTITEK